MATEYLPFLIGFHTRVCHFLTVKNIRCMAVTFYCFSIYLIMLYHGAYDYH